MNQTANPIQQALQPLTIAQAISHQGLTVHPLLRAHRFDKDYQTLDEALADRSVSVTEVSDSGSVPELLVHNRGRQAVFLLDGEELVGARQNRILNISVLAPARKDTVIPVSCVEAGRWRQTAADFKSAPRTQFSASRAKRSAHVSEDLAATGGRRSNQGEVWRDISDKLYSLGSHSDTQAVESAYVDHDASLNEYVKRLGAVETQVGAVFSIKGRIAGMELFDSQQTCGALMPKIIRSYALDAIDAAYGVRPHAGAGDPNASPQNLLDRLRSAPFREARAVGEGADLRFDHSSGLAGGALAAHGRVVHLVAFAMPEPTMRSSDRVYRRDGLASGFSEGQ
jgi:hypothetical protein